MINKTCDKCGLIEEVEVKDYETELSKYTHPTYGHPVVDLCKDCSSKWDKIYQKVWVEEKEKSNTVIAKLKCDWWGVEYIPEPEVIVTPDEVLPPVVGEVVEV